MAVNSSNPTTNLIKIKGVDVSVNTGTADAGTQRVVLATDQTVLPISDNGGSITVDGSVSLSSSLPAGTNNIGDVDIVSSVLPTGASTEATLSSLNAKIPNSLTTKAASVAALATDPALVVAISPNNTVPVTGTVELGATSLAALENISVTIPGTVDLGTVSLTALESITVTSATPGNFLTKVNGAVTTAAPAYTTGTDNALSLTTAGALRTDGSGVTQPVSGTITANLSAVDNAVLDAIEADTTAIQTAVQLLGNVIAVQDTAAPTSMNMTGGYASSTAPTAVVNGDAARIWTTLNGAVNIADGGGSITVDGTFWQATQPVSGTVTANLGTVGGLALDATLTGGTQKSIARGGAKGTTTAADVTSTNVDANTQALDVAVKGTVPVSGTFWQATQPVSGTVAVSNPGLTDTQLRATAVPVSLASVPTHAVTLASTTITGSVAVTGPLTDAQLRATAVPVSFSTAALSNATTTAYASSLIVKASAGTFYNVTGYNSKATGQFIQLHDSATLPIDTAVPKVIFYVEGLSNFSFDIGEIGRAFTSGITICNSSSGPTKTIGAADLWLDVQYK